VEILSWVAEWKTKVTMPTALIIDDSSASRTLLKGIVRSLGFTVVEAKDGESGLAAVESNWPLDLVLLDWHMEPMGGQEFLKLLRDQPRCARLPVVVITAEASRQVVIEAAQIGVQGYIVKPFNKAMVADRIAAMGLTPPAAAAAADAPAQG
jgi:two-component system chemotaxis response regulator CheY